MAKATNKITKATSDSSPDNDWDAKDALRTLTRAQEHMEDPALMKRVEKCRADEMGRFDKVKKHITVQSNEKKGKR